MKNILVESTKSNFKTLTNKPANVLKRIQGVLSDFKSNRNGRIYPRELWENVLNSDYVKEMIENHGLVGELDHPEERLEISLQNVSHVINDMWIEGDNVMGIIDILPTPSGKIVNELLDYGTDIGISSRGAGSVGTGNIVDPDYQFITFDFVARPSCEAARLNTILESVRPEIETNSDDKVNAILENYKGSLKESNTNDVPRALTNAIFSTWEGLDDMYSSYEYIEVLQDMLGIEPKDDIEDEEAEVYSLLSSLYKSKPDDFKKEVESFVYDLTQGNDDYIIDNLMNHKEIASSIKILIEYLKSNGGSEEQIEVLNNLISNIGNVSLSAREMAQEFLEVCEDTYKFWSDDKFGGDCNFVKVNYFDNLKYDAYVDYYMNFANYKNKDNVYGVVAAFKEENNQVVVDVYDDIHTFPNHTQVVKHKAGDKLGTVVIDTNDKEGSFKKIADIMINRRNQLYSTSGLKEAYHYNLAGDDVVLDPDKKVMIINGKEITFERLDQISKECAHVNRIYKPYSLLLYQDFKRGQIGKWKQGLVESSIINNSNLLLEASMSDKDVFKVILSWYKDNIENGKMTLDQAYALLSDKAKVSLNKMIDQNKITENYINSTVSELLKECETINK